VHAAPDSVVGAPAGLAGDVHAESRPDARASAGSAIGPAKPERAACSHPVRPRLLFADDLPLNRFLIRRFFEREFAEVEIIEACDGEQAVALFSAHRPDLVVLDLHMPQLDGWQAARAIRQLGGGRETPLLALSVDASPLAEANAMRAGFQEFIAKPISDYSAVKSRLEHWLALRAAQPERGPKRDCDACRLEAGRAA
jgi:CheY-like chemotaxis protein